MKHYEVIIVGAGMAGASIAAEIAAHSSVLLIEQEQYAGYHSTGRSAAFWTETYGGPLVQPLTTASGKWMRMPPADISAESFLRKRQALNIATEQNATKCDSFLTEFEKSGVRMEKVGRDTLEQWMPNIDEKWQSAVYEPDCCDIDVNAMHQAYLSAARRGGAEILCSARFEAARRNNEHWIVTINGEEFSADKIVNAAGAWADDVARKSSVQIMGIKPYRRTVVQLRMEEPVRDDLPLIVSIDGDFYFKPEAGGRLWLSPLDETLVEASDIAPEELDIAIAIDHFHSVVDWKIEAVETKWAGLRSFSPDRLPVYGFDPLAPGFYWFAGQGGVGIQTAPAAAKIAKAQILGIEAEPLVADIDTEPYNADRFE